MSWVAVAVGVAGAATSAYSANQQKKAANKANKNAGQIDQTTTRDPWAPSTDYRTAGMAHAQGLLNQGYTPIGGDPAAAPAKNRGGGGGGGGGQAQGGFNGVSDYTKKVQDSMYARAQQGHALYDPSTQYTTDLLQGRETNGYRGDTYDLTRASLEDPNNQRYIDMLFSGQMPGTAQGGGGGGYGGGGGNYSYGGGGGGGQPANQIGVAKDIRAILDGRDLNQDNPYKQAMLDKVRRQVSDEFKNSKIPGISDQYAGAGRYGGGMYADALGRAGGEYTQNLAEQIGGIEYGEYEARMADRMAALGLGTQYDMNEANNAASMSNAASAAGASAYGADRESADRMSLARMEALQGAIGMGIGNRNQNLGLLSGIGNSYSADQQAANSMVPDLSGLDIRDLSAAGQLGLGADSNRNAYQSSQNQLAASRGATSANARAQAQALQWQKDVYNSERPWIDAMRQADLINAYSGGYGTDHTFGTNSTGQQVQNSPSVAGQAIQGGLAGWYMGNQFNQGRPTSQPANQGQAFYQGNQANTGSNLIGYGMW